MATILILSSRESGEAERNEKDNNKELTSELARRHRFGLLVGFRIVGLFPGRKVRLAKSCFATAIILLFTIHQNNHHDPRNWEATGVRSKRQDEFRIIPARKQLVSHSIARHNWRDCQTIASACHIAITTFDSLFAISF